MSFRRRTPGGETVCDGAASYLSPDVSGPSDLSDEHGQVEHGTYGTISVNSYPLPVEDDFRLHIWQEFRD